MAPAPHDHAHAHDHASGPAGGHGHSHAISADADRKRLAVALGLILGFMVVEVVVGLAVSSLALLSDAAHMLTDAAAIALSLVAITLAARPARGRLTYGLKRTEILAAQFNGATLLILGVLIVVEGVRRIVDPPAVEGTPVLIVALLGVLVNLAAAWSLSQANRESLNVEGSFQHILTDLYAFAATAVAGVVIITTDFRQADGIAALFVSGTMLRAAWFLLRESGRVFLEAAPTGMDPDAIGHAMACQTGVVEVHDLHVWEVTSGFPALSAHVLVARDADWHGIRLALAGMLASDFGITHSTIQIDHDGDELLEIAPL